MTPEQRLEALVARGRELIAEGREVSVEELCPGEPELAARLAERLSELGAPGATPGALSVTGDYTPEISQRASHPPLVTADYTPASEDSSPTGPYRPNDLDSRSSDRSTTGDYLSGANKDTALEERPSVTSLGRYEILEELGRGGFGEVFLARDTRTGQTIALKTMHRQEVRALEYFKGEFRYLQGIAHPNLVQLLELESDGSQWLIGMEYVPGIDFLRYVRPRGEPGVNLDRLRDVVPQLVEGIAALHRHRRLHRDLKPQNVRVTPEGRVVILDFGLAAEAGADGELRHADPAVPGTVPYMAPEQFDSPPVSSTASDFYSLGVVLYQALTGRLPFSGKVMEVIQAKRTREPVSPKDLSPEVPGDLNTLCLDLLARWPEDRPGAVDILKRLGQQPLESIMGIGSQGEGLLLGRQHHLQILEEAYTESQKQRTVMVAVSGPSGIGKSELIRHFLDGLRGRGVVVLAGRCYEHESVPYKALDPIVDELTWHLSGLPYEDVQALLPADLASLVRVFPVLKRISAVADRAEGAAVPGDPQEVRRRAFAGLRELLSRLGRRTPLVLYIDDLQWGDIDSSYLLTDLILPPNAPPLLLITSNRSEDADSSCLRALEEALRRGGSIDRRELTVGPLTEAETRDLVVQLLGSAGAERVPAISLESGGNPFFITELVQEIQSGAKRDQTAAPEGHLTLEGLIHARVSRLPEAARRLLEVVAVSGRPITETLAYRATPDADEGRVMVARLEAARFLRGIGSGESAKLETYHDRIREAVTAGLSVNARLGHHERLAQVLEESGRGDLEELALHFAGAGQHEKAGGYYGRAADRAAESLAFDQAASFYQKALELREVEGAEARELRTKLGDALANAGRGQEAGPTYLSASEGAESLDKLELKRLAMEQFLVSGATEEGLGVLKELLDPIGQKLPGGPRMALLMMIWEAIRLKVRGTKYREQPAELISPMELWKIDLLHSAGHRLSMCDGATGFVLIYRSARWALDSGDRRRISRGLAVAAMGAGLEGGTSSRPRAEQCVEQTFTLCQRVNDPVWTAEMTHTAAVVSWGYGRWEECFERTELVEAIGAEHQVSVASYRTANQHFAYDCLMMTGRWREYAVRIEQYLQDARRRRDRFATSTMLVHSYLSLLASDRPDLAQEHLRESWDVWPQKGNVMGVYWGFVGRVETALYRGDSATALAILTGEQGELNSCTHFKFMQVLSLLMVHLQGRATLLAAQSAPSGWYFSKRSRLLRSAARQARKIEKAKMPWSNPLAKLLRAGIANLHGHQEGSLSLLAQAEEELHSASMEMYTAAARRQRGRLLGGDQGQELVQAADDFMTGQGVVKPDRIAAMLAPGFSV